MGEPLFVEHVTQRQPGVEESPVGLCGERIARKTRVLGPLPEEKVTGSQINGSINQRFLLLAILFYYITWR